MDKDIQFHPKTSRDKQLIVQTPADLDIWLRIVDVLLDGEAEEPSLTTLEETLGLPRSVALSVICNPQFTELFHSMKVAMAKSDFDRSAYDRLTKILREGSDRDAIAAVKTLGDLLGYNVKKVDVTMTFEDRLKKVSEEEVLDVEFEGL